MHELLILRRWATRIAEGLTHLANLRQTFKFHLSNFTVYTHLNVQVCNAIHSHSDSDIFLPLQIRDRCSAAGLANPLVLDFLALVRLTLSGKGGESSQWLKIFSSF